MLIDDSVAGGVGVVVVDVVGVSRAITLLFRLYTVVSINAEDGGGL